jgi:hypothetical protein
LDGDTKNNIHEFRTLLTLANGYEPQEQLLISEFHMIDLNHDQYIQLIEWLNYLSSSEIISGKSNFDFSFRIKFDKVYG